MVEFGRRSSGRAAARRATAAIENTPKRSSRGEDETMLNADEDTMAADDDDVDAEVDDDDDEDADVGADDDDDGDDEDGDADGSGDADGDGDGDADAGGSDAPEENTAATEPKSSNSSTAPGTERAAVPPGVMMVRRKRLGRPPKNRPPDWDGMVEVPMSEAEVAAAAAAAAAAASGTPRRRGRGGWRGRGGRKGQQAAATQHPVDKDGNLMDIVNDEVALPPDPEGETKVDAHGQLLGGREYRCRTFTLPGRGNGQRLYMLSTEPARCVGFRDSYLFFAKHRRLYKIIVEEDEKRDMIEREIIPHSYKGRAIGIVTARSVFREFGALIVVGGRRIVDDYEVARAREEGVEEGVLADPNDHFVPGEPYNKNQYVAWHGASSVYHLNNNSNNNSQAAADAHHLQGHQAAPKSNHHHHAKGRRTAVNNDNWQYEHAAEASAFNSALTAARAATRAGVYDIHTNQMQYPATMQPRAARALQVPPAGAAGAGTTSKVFPALPPQVARNFLVTDLYLETPPAGVAPAADARLHETPDTTAPSDFLAPFQGLGAVSEEIQALLPPECRAAFEQARAHEAQWLSRWGDEAEAMCRREPVIDKAIVPYAMTL